MLLTWLPAYRPPVTRPLTRKHRDECRAAPDRHGSCPSTQRRLPYGTAPAIQLPARRHIYRHRSRPAFGPRTLDNRPDRVPPVSARYPYQATSDNAYAPTVRAHPPDRTRHIYNIRGSHRAPHIPEALHGHSNPPSSHLRRVGYGCVSPC